MSESNGKGRLVISSLEPRTEEVEIAGKNYVLKEMTEDAHCKYQNKSSEGIVFEDGKVKSIKNAADTNPYLVSLCLFEVMSDGTQKPLDVKTLRGWTKTAMTKLTERCRELNGLDEEEETEEVLRKRLVETEEKLNKLRERGTEAKNSQSAMTGTSV